jgi:hypothetical protein
VAPDRNHPAGPLVEDGMTRLRGTLMAAAVPLFLISACAQSAANSVAGAPGPLESAATSTQGADELLLRVEYVGGFVPVERVVGALPSVSVYADGRVITDGPVRAIYPGPALPNVQVQTVSPAQLQQLVEQGEQAGVKNGADFGRPNVADAPATRVTVVTSAGTQTVSAEALSEAQAADPMLTAGQRAARTKLAAFVETLTGLSGSEGMPTPASYRARELAAIARPYAAPGEVPAENPAKAWPGPALPGETLNANTGFGCVVATGAEQDKVLATAKDATAITPWTHGGKQWSIIFRPLLPDEKGCAALKGDR